MVYYLYIKPSYLKTVDFDLVVARLEGRPEIIEIKPEERYCIVVNTDLPIDELRELVPEAEPFCKTEQEVEKEKISMSAKKNFSITVEINPVMSEEFIKKMNEYVEAAVKKVIYDFFNTPINSKLEIFNSKNF